MNTRQAYKAAYRDYRITMKQSIRAAYYETALQMVYKLPARVIVSFTSAYFYRHTTGEQQTGRIEKMQIDKWHKREHELARQDNIPPDYFAE